MNRLLFAAIVLTWTGTAFAGAWDVGSFDNDDALDWVWELSESDDLSVIENTLRAAAIETDYLEAPTASMAIAAAEVVAALRGNPRADLPDEVSQWVRAHNVPVGDRLLALARQALDNVTDEEISELAELWSETDELMRQWRADLNDLKQRLR